VTAEFRDDVLHVDSVLHAWFAAIRKSFAQRTQLARELSNLVKYSAESIDEYIARAQGLIRRVEDANMGVQASKLDAERVDRILRALPEAFAMQKAVLSVSSKMPTLRHVAAVLRGRKAELPVAAPAPAHTAFAASSEPPQSYQPMAWGPQYPIARYLIDHAQLTYIAQAAAQQAAAFAVQQLAPWEQQAPAR
jgi:hypothetical protein